MPFGVRNGPSVFQCLTDVLLHDSKDHAQNYIDDIIVYSSSWEAHVDSVLAKIKQAGFCGLRHL